ncbi:putative DNA-J protein [Diplonema papillatum]|nr:putative DNA-J protein [Diplonema papillatum]
MRRTHSLLCYAGNAHAVLGVPVSATKGEIKLAFNGLAKQHHPDVQGGDRAKFDEIRQAFNHLMDTHGSTASVSPEDVESFYYRRKQKVWEEPGVKVEDVVHEDKRSAWTFLFLRLCVTGAFGSVVVFGMQRDVDEDGLSWLDRPHPAVIATQCSPKLSTSQKKQLEIAIVKSGAKWEARFKKGYGLQLPGIGWFDYQANEVRRSLEYSKELEREGTPPPVAEWKSWDAVNSNNTRAGARLGTPAVRPPVSEMVQRERDQTRIDELESELVRLRDRVASQREAF